MEELAFYLIPLIIVALFLLNVLRREIRSQLPGREPPRGRPPLPRRETPPARVAQEAPRQERRPEVEFRWNQSSEEQLERSARPEAAAEETTGAGARRRAAPPPAPRRARQTGARRPRPSLLATRGAAREAFMTMELLRPPLGLRNPGDTDRMDD